MIVSKKLIIKGRVQGVWYRVSAKKEAELLGLNGFVMNQPDGCVYAEVEGEAADVETFIEWCNRGPQFAKVQEVAVEDKEVEGLSGFEVKSN